MRLPHTYLTYSNVFFDVLSDVFLNLFFDVLFDLLFIRCAPFRDRDRLLLQVLQSRFFAAVAPVDVPAV